VPTGCWLALHAASGVVAGRSTRSLDVVMSDVAKVFEMFMLVAVMASPLLSRATDYSQSPAIPTTSAVVVGAPPGVTYSGGDGLDCAQAVKINGAIETTRGIAAEKAWLRARYPGVVFHRQTLRHSNDTSFDVLDIETKEHKRLSICFDIGEFFGK
jgi:hypothetical protein